MAEMPNPVEMNIRVQPVIKPETAAALHKLIDSVEAALTDARHVLDTLTGGDEDETEYAVHVESPNVTIQTKVTGKTESEARHPWQPGQVDPHHRH